MGFLQNTLMSFHKTSDNTTYLCQRSARKLAKRLKHKHTPHLCDHIHTYLPTPKKNQKRREGRKGEGEEEKKKEEKQKVKTRLQKQFVYFFSLLTIILYSGLTNIKQKNDNLKCQGLKYRPKDGTNSD